MNKALRYMQLSTLIKNVDMTLFSTKYSTDYNSVNF